MVELRLNEVIDEELELAGWTTDLSSHLRIAIYNRVTNYLVSSNVKVVEESYKDLNGLIVRVKEDKANDFREDIGDIVLTVKDIYTNGYN